MKMILAISTVLLAASSALAVPGGSSLTCTSAHGSKQSLIVKLTRANTTGFATPTISVSLNAKLYEFSPTDETKNYGETVHNSPLGVIMVTAEDFDENQAIRGGFTVTGIPKTVKAFDQDGKAVKWSLKAEANDCNDANGKAKFKGVFRGYLNIKSSSPTGTDLILDPQILDCELDYNSGSAC